MCIEERLPLDDQQKRGNSPFSSSTYVIIYLRRLEHCGVGTQSVGPAFGEGSGAASKYKGGGGVTSAPTKKEDRGLEGRGGVQTDRNSSIHQEGGEPCGPSHFADFRVIDSHGSSSTPCPRHEQPVVRLILANVHNKDQPHHREPDARLIVTTATTQTKASRNRPQSHAPGATDRTLTRSWSLIILMVSGCMRSPEYTNRMSWSRTNWWSAPR